MAAAASATLHVEPARATVQQQVPRKSRRRKEVLMTEEDEIQASKRIRATTINSRQKATRNVYKSYVNTIHEWYSLHRREVCNDDGELIFDKIAENCLTPQGLKDEAKSFKKFLNARTHIRKFLDEEKKIPAKAGVGTLLGFRSAFNYYVWTRKEDSLGIPYAWNACLRGYFQGLKNRE